MTNDQFTTHGVHPRRISGRTIVLALLTIGTFIAVSGVGERYITPMIGGIEYGGNTKAVPPTAVSAPMVDTSMMAGSGQGTTASSRYYPYPYPTPEVSVTDTRELLKIYYNATMRTRDVPTLTRRVETTVRGYEGRIDQESSSAQYGSISFAVPQSKYEAFRAELETLVDSRFLSVNISSQNMLPQKVSIEEQQKQAATALADFKTARQKIVSTHTLSVQTLQSKISADEDQLATLRAGTLTPEILIQIQTVSDDWTALKQQLTNENASYTAQLSNADANIKYAQDWQKAVQTQDQTLLNSIATVTGTVSIQWISLWDIALLYLPGYWIPSIFAALTFLSFLWDRRRFASTR